MIVFAWMALLCLTLALVGWVCDRWPTADERSVDTYAVFRRNLGGRR